MIVASSSFVIRPSLSVIADDRWYACVSNGTTEYVLTFINLVENGLCNGLVLNYVTIKWKRTQSSFLRFIFRFAHCGENKSFEGLVLTKMEAEGSQRERPLLLC